MTLPIPSDLTLILSAVNSSALKFPVPLEVTFYIIYLDGIFQGYIACTLLADAAQFGSSNSDCDIVVLQTAEFHTFLHGDVQCTVFRSDNKTGNDIVGAISLYSCGIYFCFELQY